MSQLLIISSFLFFLIVFTAIGALASRVKTTSSEDYLVASRDVSPWLIALSAVSTNNSGYMFIGLIGFTWRQGIEAVWITFGWILGDLLTWFWVHRRVRAQSEDVGAASVPALLATDRNGRISRPIAVVAGLLTFFFLGGYAAAQLKAGSTTLHALFDWPLWAGSTLGVVIVSVYCMSGGIRASIWTDAAQSIVMIGAMALLLGACVMEVGGPGALFDALRALDPALVDVIPNGLAFGLGLYILGFVFGGVATIGQPHILVRFMAIDATDSIKRARLIYFTWYTFFSIGALAVGLYARVLLPDLGAGLDDTALAVATEGALPALSVKMLPPLLIGVMLAGLFSATMSTADSQILSCSAAVTQDVAPRFSQSYNASKIATLSVAGLALLIALTATSGVFSLVLIAWSALGASLGPILLIRLAHRPLSARLALVMMTSGIATVIAWGASPWADDVFKALPGIAVPLIIYALAMFVGRDRPPVGEGAGPPARRT
ncbi:MAG: sodium/proline symporter [Myxococcales bacterium]|nr:sodium/proline symporter [Myxococcales bacterium]